MSLEKQLKNSGLKRNSPEELSERLQAIESKVDGLVPHILQLENAAILIVGLIVLLQVLGTLWLTQPDAEITRLYWFIPYATLFLVGHVIKIRNPYNRVAEIVETGFNYAGAGALVGGSMTALLSGGLGAPAGGAIGGGVGFVAGIAAGIFKTVGKAKAQSSERVPCQFCGRHINRADKYCEQCGKEQFLSSVDCPKCKAKVSMHAKFCPNCGKPLSEAETSALPGGDSLSAADRQEPSQGSTAGGVQSQVSRQDRSGIATARFTHLADYVDELEETKEEGRADSKPTGAEKG